MKEIQNMINNKIDEKINNGDFDKIVDEAVKSMFQKILNESTNSWGEPYKLLEKKIQESMCQHIEKYDFSKHLIKFTEVLDEIMKAPTVKQYNQVAKNLKALFTVKVPESEISLNEIFDKYCKYVEDDCTISYSDCENAEEGTTCVTCKFEKVEDSYSGDYKFSAYRDDGEELEDFTYYIAIRKWHFNDKYSIYDSYKEEEKRLNSIRYASEFDIYLMLIKQSSVYLNDLDEYLEDDVYVSVDY